jgi:hypothetical protein
MGTDDQISEGAKDVQEVAKTTSKAIDAGVPMGVVVPGEEPLAERTGVFDGVEARRNFSISVSSIEIRLCRYRLFHSTLYYWRRFLFF